jgi:hypothetical protein
MPKNRNRKLKSDHGRKNGDGRESPRLLLQNRVDVRRCFKRLLLLLEIIDELP